MEEENSNLESHFHLGRTKASFFNLNNSVESKDHARIYKQLPIQMIDNNLFTIIKKIGNQFVLIFASIAIEQYENLAERFEQEQEKGLINSIELKLMMNSYDPKSKDIFKMTEPSKKITCGDIFDQIGQSKVDDSIYFGIKRKLLASSMPKVHLEHLVKLVTPIMTVNEDGLSISKLGSVVGTLQSLALSPKQSATKSPKGKSGAFPFHLMARWATKMYDPARINLKKAPTIMASPNEKDRSEDFYSPFMDELEKMNRFYQFKFSQNGAIIYVIVKVLLPSAFIRKPALQVNSYM